MIVDDDLLGRVLGKVKKGITKFADIKILIDTNDKLPGHIISKKVIILIACAVKDSNKLYLWFFLEYALYLR